MGWAVLARDMRRAVRMLDRRLGFRAAGEGGEGGEGREGARNSSILAPWRCLEFTGI
jgi:hypothetical protein